MKRLVPGFGDQHQFASLHPGDAVGGHHVGLHDHGHAGLESRRRHGVRLGMAWRGVGGASTVNVRSTWPV